MWCIPPKQNAAFVCCMEQVLEVYTRPYDPLRPVVCMDEMPKQLLGESAPATVMAPGRPKRVDHEYVRHGTCTVWMFTEPLGAWRDVRVSERRTSIDWAHQIRALLEDHRYCVAERITLVCDNLSTHALSSLYQAFEPAEALHLAHRLEIVHTPKHGSWLNIAEIELSVLSRQCSRARMASIEALDKEIQAWQHHRNQSQRGVDWHFATPDARAKLKRLYPHVKL